MGGGSPRKFNPHKKLFTSSTRDKMAWHEGDVKYQKTLCVHDEPSGGLGL